MAKGDDTIYSTVPLVTPPSTVVTVLTPSTSRSVPTSLLPKSTATRATTPSPTPVTLPFSLVQPFTVAGNDTITLNNAALDCRFRDLGNDNITTIGGDTLTVATVLTPSALVLLVTLSLVVTRWLHHRWCWHQHHQRWWGADTIAAGGHCCSAVQLWWRCWAAAYLFSISGGFELLSATVSKLLLPSQPALTALITTPLFPLTTLTAALHRGRCPCCGYCLLHRGTVAALGSVDTVGEAITTGLVVFVMPHLCQYLGTGTADVFYSATGLVSWLHLMSGPDLLGACPRFFMDSNNPLSRYLNKKIIFASLSSMRKVNSPLTWLIAFHSNLFSLTTDISHSYFLLTSSQYWKIWGFVKRFPFLRHVRIFPCL